MKPHFNGELLIENIVGIITALLAFLSMMYIAFWILGPSNKNVKNKTDNKLLVKQTIKASVIDINKIKEKRQAEEARKKVEAEKKRQAEEARKKVEAEKKRRAEEARKKVEAEKKRRAEEARKKVEAEKKRRAEEARKKAEAEKKRRAEEARKKAEAEKKRRAEEARKKAEAEKKRRAEEARKKAEAEKLAAKIKAAKDKENAINRFSIAIKDKLRDNWVIPAKLPAGLSAKLMIKTIGNGEIKSVKIIQSSGNMAFDNSAIQAVRQSEPLPMPPRIDWAKEFETININFP